MTFDDRQHRTRRARALRARDPGRPGRWRCPAATRCTMSPCWRPSSSRRGKASPFPFQPEEDSPCACPVAVSVSSRQRCCSRARRCPRRRNRRPAIRTSWSGSSCPRRRAGRPTRSPACIATKLQTALGQTGDRREPRRRRWHGRHRLCRQDAAGRLHHADHHGIAHRHSGLHAQHALRRGEGLHARHPAGGELRPGAGRAAHRCR